MNSKKPKRFIAGAVCPRCAEMDKLVMYENEMGERVRECIRCAYADVISEDGVPRELKTRVNEPRPGEKPLAHEDEVQVLKLFDPKLFNPK